MGDKTPESVSMDQYFDRLKSDHSPSILARSGRTARCQPRSRLGKNRSDGILDSKRRLQFVDDSDDEEESGKKRKRIRDSKPIDVVNLSSSQSSVEEDRDSKQRILSQQQEIKQKRRFAFTDDDEESLGQKKSVSDDTVAARSDPQVVPFADQNGNSCVVRPETRRSFVNLREVPVDEEARRMRIERARRVRAMEEFQKEVLNSGDEFEEYKSGVETDLDDDLFDDFNDLNVD
ncbi:hypothetical protein PFISCL1PPCAC_24771 [Pristionchus fissidentatus]|uniref:Uncharacterized protein n=1 Tax=Pristionchus fissidentatus TaxID=1538716 RepID=A0AAV5WV23_9BILA|nr:hypothetical protein PFISCL1PPCAC_24771 [Pristionchus fissidentatus]